jgi:monoamine oxidase
MKTVIIGGGISGLYIYHRLNDPNTTLLEKKTTLGGRIKTEMLNNKVLYETGPWRIHEKHKRVRQLCYELGLEESLASESKQNALYKNEFDHTTKHNNFLSEISEFGNRIIDMNISDAVETELATGYSDIFSKASNTRNYDLSGGSFFVLNDGLHAIIDRLVVKSNTANIRSGHFVTDVQRTKKGYKIAYYTRNKPTSYMLCERLILCLPPHETRHWTIAQHLRPIINAVGTLSLNHLYAKTDQRMTIDGSENFKIITDNPLSQVVSSNYDNNWVQVSYSAGRVADFWHGLSLTDLFKPFLNEQFKHITGYSQKLIDVKNYYWKNAVHYWQPNYKTTAKSLMRRSVVPHMLLDNLYIAGEAVSTNQGWLEGALETASLVLDLLSASPRKNIIFPKEYVIYDGRVLDVEHWKHFHPGSVEAINNHLYEDITRLWNSIHPEYSTKYLLALENKTES